MHCLQHTLIIIVYTYAMYGVSFVGRCAVHYCTYDRDLQCALIATLTSANNIEVCSYEQVKVRSVTLSRFLILDELQLIGSRSSTHIITQTFCLLHPITLLNGPLLEVNLAYCSPYSAKYNRNKEFSYLETLT